MSAKLLIGVGEDKFEQWHIKFSSALEKFISEGVNVEYEIVDLEAHDWLERAAKYDVLLWKSDYMGAYSSTLFKEKIYILEKYLQKKVVPNYNSVWHFESKIAQSYLFELFNVNTPNTIVSLDYFDSVKMLEQAQMPLVVKKSHGAGSKNVHLVHDRSKIRALLAQIFCHQLWKIEKRKYGVGLKLVISNMFKPWFFHKLLMLLSGEDKFKAVYWQDFISGNNSDLRITVIGNRFAYAFWRKNRPNDFRASGSGRIDYQTPVPESAIKYCLGLSEKMGFDSMAYDIVFHGDKVVIVEMSYAYLDTAIYKANGYFELLNDKLNFREGHYWPQELWVKWLLVQAGRLS